MAPFTHKNRVRYAEADEQGVVFYGNYLIYQDEAFMAYLRELGYDKADRDWDVHVVHTSLDYRAPATVGEVLENEFRIASIGETSFDSEYRTRRADDGTVVAEGTLTHVVVAKARGEPIRVPDTFRNAVVAFQDEAPNPV